MKSEQAQSILTSSASNNALVLFHCMYSRERGPTCARIAQSFQPELRVAILRGGFQQAMATHWVDSAPPSALLEGVRRERWVQGPGKQGLIWGPDADPLAFAAMTAT